MLRLKCLSITIVFALLMIFTIGGASANWFYPGLGAVDKTLQYQLEALYWDGSEDLPDDDIATQLGQNHMDLIQKIINDLRYGLNSTSSTLMHNYLKKDGDVLYCEQQVSGGNLKHLMIDGTAAYALLFQIEYVSATDYHIYTYNHADAEQFAIGSSIEVYFTEVMKTNGTWAPTKTRIGTAIIIDPPDKKFNRAIDSSYWVEK